MDSTTLFITLLFCTKHGIAYHSDELVTPPQDMLDGLVEYTLYEKEVTFNDAVRICELDNARMLSIKTQNRFSMIEDFKKHDWNLLNEHDYWGGLTEPNPYSYVWEDCTPMTTFDMLKGESYNDNELCYKVKHDSLEWESKKCSEKHYFACEKKIPGECEQKTTLNSNELSNYANMSTSQCQNMCTTNPLCWSGISTNSGLCILLANDEGIESSSEVTMFRKLCTKVLRKTEGEIPTVDENSDLQPLLNCTTTYSNSSVPPLDGQTTPEYSSIISPSPCYLYETMNITNVYNITDTINSTVTETLNFTFTINVTETFNVTQSLPVTSFQVHVLTTTITENLSPALFVTSTINITQTHNITDFYNVTIYESHCTATCFNGTQHYLSPDDPVLINAIASMKKELTVDKKSTNSHQRKLRSARDDRTSSQVIGFTGLAFLIVPLILICIVDIPTIFRGRRKQNT